MRVVVVGMGYVGLPLAVALSRYFPVTGYDVNADRVAGLKKGMDTNGEVDPAQLRSSAIRFTADAENLAGADIYVLTVPTPLDADLKPDLSLLLAACETVGRVISRGATVVIESTVYPGVTEQVCGPCIEAVSGLKCGKDFFLGYSPERINPGDREHSVEQITKVVAGQTPEVTKRLCTLYGTITRGGVFVARDIRTAEAAKAIENAQRDINVAFVNEVAQICDRLGLSVYDVLEAAKTKWNFLDFRPGLVGGHCIGVDPLYLAHCAEQAGHHPEVILAGRRINDSMGAYMGGCIARALSQPDRTINDPLSVLVLGLTFKENVRDLRNSKVVELVAELRGHGFEVRVHDPLADPDEAAAFYGIGLIPTLVETGPYDCVVGAVAHATYASFTAETLAGLVQPNGLVADVKGIWRHLVLPPGIRRWQL